MPKAFITANKLHRYGYIIAHSHANLQDLTQQGHLIMIFCLVTHAHPGQATCHFQLLDVAVMAAPMRSFCLHKSF